MALFSLCQKPLSKLQLLIRYVPIKFSAIGFTIPIPVSDWFFSRKYEKLVDGGLEAHLIALACGKPRKVMSDGPYVYWQIKRWN